MAAGGSDKGYLLDCWWCTAVDIDAHDGPRHDSPLDVAALRAEPAAALLARATIPIQERRVDVGPLNDSPKLQNIECHRCMSHTATQYGTG